MVTCIRLCSYFGNKITYEIYYFSKGASSTDAFGSSTSTKRVGHVLSTKALNGLDQTVRRCGANSLCINRISLGS
jgi:hypothetical protein